MQTLIAPYGRTRSGEDVARVTIGEAIQAEILTYGGIVARLLVPGGDGRAENVVLGLSDLDGYESRSPSFGATIGRYANRIGGAQFTLDGTEYRLSANEGANTLHGGADGFSHRVWTTADASATAVTLARISPAGEEGFPGTLRTTVRFAVEGMTLRLHYRAETDAPTVLNLTNHSYFNLAGEGSGDIWSHEVRLAADQFLALREDSIPTGALLEVAGTPFDFPRLPTRRGAGAGGARANHGRARL